MAARAAGTNSRPVRRLIYLLSGTLEIGAWHSADTPRGSSLTVPETVY
jgi:hypothetical protein